MEVKFCPECGKPVQPALLSTKRQACASCGWTGNIIEKNPFLQKEQVLKPRTTVPKKKLQIDGLGEALTLGFGSLVTPLLGLALLIIPVIGWILGLGLIFASIGGFLVSLRAVGIAIGLIKPAINDYKLEGICPYCDNSLSVNLPSERTTCGFCKERVLVKKEKFHTIIRKTYDND
ncbi:MAG: hypothetical protein RLZZ535_2895 [Cyanobacteriota bacterium]